MNASSDHCGVGNTDGETRGRQPGLPSTAPYYDLTEAIERSAREQGDRIFLRSVDQGKSLTFAELGGLCARVSHYLGDRGLGAGSMISLIGKNSVETLVLYLGTLYHGAVINPINVDESPDNIYKILGLVRPRIVFHDQEMALDASRLKNLNLVSFKNIDSSRAEDLFSSLARLSPVRAHASRTPEDLAEVVFTSGTTSTPKGVCITRGSLFAMGAEIVHKIGLTRDDVLLEYRNYNWASAQLLTILSSVLSGATLVLARRFSRSRFPSWLVDHGVTVSAGVPTVINILAKEPVALPDGGHAKLRFMTSSSAPLSVASQVEFEKVYGIPILQMAGMTEAGFMLGNPFEGRKIGSAGTPCRFKEVFFVDSEGKVCPPGEQGEMVVRGYSIGLGYLREDGSVDPFPEEGFRTGDLGHVDADGFCFITGRAKDLIIRGGVNIAPMEITTRILEHPTVKEAATIGVPDAIYGEEVASFVVPKEGSSLDGEEVIAHCRKSLPDFKVPKRVYVVDSIPKTERGKVQTRKLLAIFEARSQECGAVNPA